MTIVASLSMVERKVECSPLVGQACAGDSKSRLVSLRPIVGLRRRAHVRAGGCL